MEITAFRSSTALSSDILQPRRWPGLGWGLAIIVASGASGGVYVLLAFPLAPLASLALLACAIVLLLRMEAGQAQRLQGERRKISLDLHDGAIQPYLGLKLGLEALRRKASPDNPLAHELDELYRMTQESIAELRGYVHELRGLPVPAGTLANRLRRQSERFRRFYGFAVDIGVAPELRVPEALAAEVVRMVGEGLSNIGRHTSSRQVTVAVTAEQRRLVVEIVNQRGARAAWRQFTPASLTQRAQRLGGRVEVAPHGNGDTAVRVILPLRGK